MTPELAFEVAKWFVFAVIALSAASAVLLFFRGVADQRAWDDAPTVTRRREWFKGE